MLVHVSGAGGPILLSVGDDAEQFVAIADIGLGEIFDKTALLVLPELEVVLGDVQAIAHFFHVEFEDGDLELELDGVGRLLDGGEQSLDLSRPTCTILGMMPLFSFSFRSYPCIVCVFPELVCPYAMIVPWKPSRMLFSTGLPIFSNTSSCVLSVSKQWSKRKDISSFLASRIMSCCLLLIRWMRFAFAASSLLLNGRNLQKTFMLPSPLRSIT